MPNERNKKPIFKKPYSNKPRTSFSGNRDTKRDGFRGTKSRNNRFDNRFTDASSHQSDSEKKRTNWANNPARPRSTFNRFTDAPSRQYDGEKKRTNWGNNPNRPRSPFNREARETRYRDFKGANVRSNNDFDKSSTFRPSQRADMGQRRASRFNNNINTSHEERNSTRPRSTFNREARETKYRDFKGANVRSNNDFDKSSVDCPSQRADMEQERAVRVNNNINIAQEEIKYYGINACESIFKCRKNDIIKVYIENSLIKRFSPLLKWCAEQKKSYHIVENEDLNKICDSTHHEGISLLCHPLPKNTFSSFLQIFQKLEKKSPLIYLDGVQNPHNLGSIVRACTHFGVPYIMGDERDLPSFSPSCARIAQGGCEIVKLLPLQKSEENLYLLKNEGFSIVATSSHKGSSLFDFSFKPKTIFVIGGESLGISQKIEKLADATLIIPGTLAIESLNLSQAAAIFLSEYWRQLRARD